MPRPRPLYPLLALHLLLGASALYGGWSLLVDPAGLGVQSDWIAHSPFGNYVVPGWFLFLMLGVFPVFVALGLWKKPVWPWAAALNVYANRHWAWTYSLFTGLILIGWITVQIIWMPQIWLQPFFLAVGLQILIFTLWPGVLRHFETATVAKIQAPAP